MPSALHRLTRRVLFHETDMAGVVHFSCFFRYMEEAEHALWREAGLSIAPPRRRDRLAARGRVVRVSAAAPLRGRVRGVRCASRRSRTGRFAMPALLTRGGETVATGAMTIACVSQRPNEPMTVRRHSAGSHRSRFRWTAEPPRTRRDARRDRAASRRVPRPRRDRPPRRRAVSSALARAHPRPQSLSTRASSMRPASTSTRCDFRTICARLPLTTKRELVADQDAHPPWGTALTEPIDHYTRYCQTSSTTGRPLRWIDTNESWQWVVDCWKAVYRAARVGSGDRIFFPFSFGPFLGFWSAFDAGVPDRRALRCPAAACRASCGWRRSTPSAPRSCAARRRTRCGWPKSPRSRAACSSAAAMPLPDSSVRVLIVAGEPGGSIPATRARIEDSWGARVIDHHGLTEVGPVSFECWEQPGGLHLNEAEFVCEVIDPRVRPSRAPTASRASWSSPTSAGRPVPSSAIAPATSSSRRSERLRVRPDVGAARRRHSVARRRHGGRPRRQRVSGGDRSGRAAVFRRSSSSDRP